MSRSAAVRMASRVVLPSRVLAAGLELVVWILVVLMCTNWSVQTVPPPEHRVKYMGGPEMAPPNPPAFGAARRSRAAPLTPAFGAARRSRAAPLNPSLRGGPAKP